ncbi:AraC family transcriptional regulator [Microbulbifer agarilyticus]|uniref:AraC family transcriptional regulator n=1 Tax=Microbulbifer agarilyticus TaxID=260552 RepID=A0A1Q2M8S0_9GAMM|nr:AraC family transcriptional regulator [Microbulbifer agarilyticus]AQQ69071.1 AraC family transcriptional regulator [Microbulbifer agarilyticus]
MFSLRDLPSPSTGIRAKFGALLTALTLMSAGQTFAQEGDFPAEDLESLKKEVLKLNRDLLVLEEDLLFPAQSQVAVYVSMDVGHFFDLDSVKLHINNKLVETHLYTEHQKDALFRGGIQPLFKGNLKSGEHTITAFFNGIGPEQREFKRAASLDLKKTDEPAVIELRISDAGGKQQPEFTVVQWPAP